MSDYFAMSETELNALANAIKQKTGHTGQILGSQMASEIQSISSLSDILTGGSIYVDFDVPYQAFYQNPRITSVTFGPNCHSIGQNAFYQCTGITSLDFSNSGVTTIGAGAFYNCTGLTSLDLTGSSVTTIGASAFYNCTGLRSASFGSTLQTIGSNGFNACSNLEGTLVFPASFYQIDTYGFQNCPKLTTLIMLRSSGVVALQGTTSSAYVFKNTKFNTADSGAIIYVPANLLSSYQTANQWATTPTKNYLTPYTSSATIGTDTYSYDYGNTFAQWVASAYNTDGFVVSGNNILNSAKTHYVAENGIAVSPTKQFIGVNYTLEAI